ANGCADIFVRDLVNGRTERVTHDFAGGDADDASYQPYVTADGRFVAFSSLATDLVPGDVNGNQDVFMFDRVKQTTICLSVDPAGGITADDRSDEPSLSADGRVAAF